MSYPAIMERNGSAEAQSSYTFQNLNDGTQLAVARQRPIAAVLPQARQRPYAFSYPLYTSCLGFCYFCKMNVLMQVLPSESDMHPGPQLLCPVAGILVYGEPYLVFNNQTPDILTINEEQQQDNKDNFYETGNTILPGMIDGRKNGIDYTDGAFDNGSERNVIYYETLSEEYMRRFAGDLNSVLPTNH